MPHYIKSVCDYCNLETEYVIQRPEGMIQLTCPNCKNKLTANFGKIICPKCRTENFENCHSIKCPMRK